MCRYCEELGGFGARIGGDDLHFNIPDGKLVSIDQRIVGTYDSDKLDIDYDRSTYYIRTFMDDDWINSYPIFYCPMCGKKLGVQAKDNSLVEKKTMREKKYVDEGCED